jgi:hypothetical protein
MDRMQAPPRGAFFGLLSDLASGTVGYMKDPRRTQQLQGLGAMLESTRIPSLLEGLSYGDSLVDGSGMTMRPNEDVRGLIELATAFAPAGKPAAAAAKAGTMALGRAGERMAERVVPHVMERGGLPAEMLGAMAQGTQSPATVFHGSPHLFQRFDSSKIGTGEGAQVYGHGLYLAENPAVAGEYALNLANKNIANQGRLNAHANAQRLASLAGDPKYAADDVRFVLEQNPDHLQKDLLTETLKMLESGDYKKPLKNKGNLYQVDLPDEQIAKMLDYDKPLSKQPPEVRAWLSSPYNAYRNQLTANDVGGNEPTGAMILGKLQELMSEGKKNDVFTNTANFGAANASRELAEAGIPGIRYFDQGSRSNFRVQNTVKGQPYGEPVTFMTERQAQDYIKEQAEKGFGTEMLPGTSNFVVFPGMEDMLRIEQINEQPINSLLQTLGR